MRHPRKWRAFGKTCRLDESKWLDTDESSDSDIHVVLVHGTGDDNDSGGARTCVTDTGFLWENTNIYKGQRETITGMSRSQINAWCFI